MLFDLIVVILPSPDAHDARVSDNVSAAKIHRNADKLFFMEFCVPFIFILTQLSNRPADINDPSIIADYRSTPTILSYKEM